VVDSMPADCLNSKKPQLFNHVSKLYMEWFIGKVPFFSIRKKSFKKSKKKLQ
jgi:hypothetical protein